MRVRSLIADSMQILQTFAVRAFDHRSSILILHDIDEWALDHVFHLWFGDCRAFRIVRLNWNRISTARAFRGHQLIIFGYLDIYLRFKCCPSKAVVVIHDPCELFPQVPNWREVEPLPDRIEVIRSVRAVVVISEELEAILAGYGIKTHRIPTMSRLPVHQEDEPAPLAASAVSIFKDYPRKNAGLLRRLAEKGSATGRWRLTLHETPDFNDAAYLDLIDRTPIYVCASWQEGGPLPAMDVMSRGGVVVTTRVGQMQEIITDGESGFFCSSQDEFERTLVRLFQSGDALEQARRKSLTAYRRHRDKTAIRETVGHVFARILERP